MEVAPEPAPLLLPRRHQPFARPLERARQGDGVRGDARLPGEVGEQLPVRGRELALAGT